MHVCVCVCACVCSLLFGSLLFELFVTFDNIILHLLSFSVGV